MAKYKCLPYYELTRNGKTITFDIDGIYKTDIKSQIDLLDSCRPFVERVDKPKPSKKKKKAVPKKKTTASKNAKTNKK